MADFSNIIALNNSLKPALEESVVVALSTGRALMDRRIFGEGEAADGTPIGKYKTVSYRAFREEKGRQTNYVDLRFKGDLQNSLQVIPVSRSEVGIGFLNNFEAKKASGNEKNFNKTIFNLSDQELDTVYNTIIDELVKRIG